MKCIIIVVSCFILVVSGVAARGDYVPRIIIEEDKVDIEKLLVDESYSDEKYFAPDPDRDDVSFRGFSDWINSIGNFFSGKPDDDDEDALNCFGLGGKIAKAVDSYLTKDPNGTKSLKSVFHATSRYQPGRVEMRHGESFKLNKIDFDIRRRTIFIVPGFLSGSGEQWTKDMEQAFLKWGDVNVFVVDWSEGSNTINYLKASVNTKTVGDQIATFIMQLAQPSIDSGFPSTRKFGKLHLIGHSLGAHICGYAAHELKRRNSTWLAERITGLDPAQPCFRNSHARLRLDRDDAPFVDILHTNGRILKKLGLGMPYPLGHVDFYPNGGTIQPGCLLSKASFWSFIPLPVDKLKKTICSHGRSQVYLTESIISAVEKNCTFWGRDWDLSLDNVDKYLTVDYCEKLENYNQCIEMGINAEKYRRSGTYFALTAASAPYCRVDSKAVEEAKSTIEKHKRKDGTPKNEPEKNTRRMKAKQRQ